jgi:hypothetical protein
MGEGGEERRPEDWGEGMDVPTRKRFRQGRRRLFHLYQALRMGERGAEDMVRWCWDVEVKLTMNGSTRVPTQPVLHKQSRFPHAII